MRSLLIRADAGTRIGSGHVMRCLALAHAWRDRGGRAAFLTNAPDVEDFETIPAPEAGDVERAIETARARAADWVVVDGYRFDSGYLRALRDAGLRVLAIDDHGRAGEYAADAILDVNLAAREDAYRRRPAGARLLLGTRYALLRREFRGLRPAPKPALARTLLVTLGGADPGNATLRVVETLVARPEPRPETVVLLGPDNPHRSVLERAVAGTSIRLETGGPGMAARMAWADAAISGAGGTAWELAYMGVPSMLVVAAENQRPNADALAAAGAALRPEDGLDALLADGPRRARLAERGRALVDGRGADRVAAALEAGLLRLRRASDADARVLWEWANDPEVRAVSFTPAPIPWETHVAWLRRKLDDPGCFLYIVEEEGVPMGQTRFDVQGAEAVVSVSLAKGARGRGWGGDILRRACAALFETSTARVVRAYVKPGNEASARAFADAGFESAAPGAPNHPEALHWVLRAPA
ncbi:MAG TPA: UDP-2,4-diacetamido-2,4,6-trideoxy-beta-L-altropyranose hydrolase [Planctomycetota bacterium]